MKCTNHPEVDAQGMCAYCGKPFCADCLVEVKGRMYCKADLGNVLDEAKQSNSSSQPTITINNSNENTNTNANINAAMFGVRMKNKWVAFFLCLFLGFLGAHKFYEGKAGAGILYLLTGGLFTVGWFIDCIVLLCKPNPYYVR